jgi:hypothetical protein
LPGVTLRLTVVSSAHFLLCVVPQANHDQIRLLEYP